MFTEQEIQTIKKSPIFNFSLSSKELFHSNFLYWLLIDITSSENGEYESKLFWTLLCEKLNLQNDLLDFQIGLQNDIYREQNNTDLRFTIVSSNRIERRVILENKVKSIPYLSQLEEYSNDANDSDILVLLTLHDPNFLKNDNGKIEISNGKIWHVLSYDDFKFILTSFIEKSKSSNTYRKNIITDYLLLLNALLKMDKHAVINLNENFNWHINDFYRQLQDLRIADFYIKKKFTQLEEILKNSIQDDQLISNMLKNELDWNSMSPQILVTSGFTNGSGLLDIKYKFKDHMSVGLQIQGRQFRMVIEEDVEMNAYNFAEILNNNYNWFDFTAIEGFGNAYPLNNGLNKFGPKFWYRYVNLPENTSINQLIDYIKRFLIKYHSKSTFLKEKLNEL